MGGRLFSMVCKCFLLVVLVVLLKEMGFEFRMISLLLLFELFIKSGELVLEWVIEGG